MRWATYVSPGDGSERAGLLVGDSIHGLEPGVRLIDLLGDDGAKLDEAAGRASADPVEIVPVSGAGLRAPIPQPPSIRDSSSFEAHLRAGFDALGVPFDADWYRYPLFYFSNPHGMVGSGQSVVAAPGASKLDFELEVAAIVGREGSNLSPEQAESHIAGYCIFNDWSARDIQSQEIRFKVGPFKTKDWAMSSGPLLVTPDEIAPYARGAGFDLAMTASVNGRQVSEGNLADIYWSFSELVAFSSRGTYVKPGDLIASGTVGTGCIFELAATHGADRYPWLQPGDEVTLEVERLGRLVNDILPPPALKPLRPGVWAAAVEPPGGA